MEALILRGTSPHHANLRGLCDGDGISFPQGDGHGYGCREVGAPSGSLSGQGWGCGDYGDAQSDGGGVGKGSNGAYGPGLVTGAGISRGC